MWNNFYCDFSFGQRFAKRITYAPAVKHLHGHLGKMVFKERQGQDIVAEKPDQVNQPNSPAQRAQRESFRQAAAYAKGAMADTAAHAAYLAKANELHSSPVAVAVKDWMTPPVVTAIDLSNYNKHVGDAILIAAQDDFAVTGGDGGHRGQHARAGGERRGGV